MPTPLTRHWMFACAAALTLPLIAFIALMLVGINIGLMLVGIALFDRESILTRWK